MSHSLVDGARALLRANTQTGVRDGASYRFSVPSVRAYPFQWFWDSCFHAIVWSRVDGDRAADELRGLLAWQTSDGLIPHVVFWNRNHVSPLSWHYLESQGRTRWLPLTGKPRVTAGIQPPVIAQAVERIAAAGHPRVAEDLVLPLYRYYRYLAATRDPDGDALISIISQFESGLDFSPAYDPAIGVRDPGPVSLVGRARATQVANKLMAFDVSRIARRFGHHQEDVLVNTIYGQGLRSLARLADRARRPAIASWARRQADRVTAALLERCWDERSGLFHNLIGPGERRDPVRTVHSLMPLALTDLPASVAASLVEHLTDRRTFWAPFPVPSVALEESTFAANGRIRGLRFIWRGPTSMNTNWFLVHGLRRHGYQEIASTIAGRSAELASRHGFNEFYDPLRGNPVGAPDFGWATLVVDM
ncbi:MAG: hypothetical protein ACE5EV_01120 [Gaiellales bacterium]